MIDGELKSTADVVRQVYRDGKVFYRVRVVETMPSTFSGLELSDYLTKKKYKTEEKARKKAEKLNRKFDSSEFTIEELGQVQKINVPYVEQK